MTHAFISYSHQDTRYAHKLAAEMKRRGIEVWIDDRIDHGAQWQRVLQENLERCQVLIVIMTTNAFNSDWVQNELAFARELRKPILPLRVEGKSWASLAATQHVDVKGGKMPPDSFYNTVKRHLAHETRVRGLRMSRYRVVPIAPEERALRERILQDLQAAITDKRSTKWEIGIFEVGYLNVSPAWTEFDSYNYVMLSSKLINESLLKRFDPDTYNDYKSSHEALLRKKNELLKKRALNKTTPPTNDPLIRTRRRRVRVDREMTNVYTVPRLKLLQRLNLDLGQTFTQAPTQEEIYQFAIQIIRLHKAHHIPISEIKVKALAD